jgi:type VI secretion system Hcp family effector
MSMPMVYLKLYVKGKPVPGESELSEYEGQIEVESLSWDVSADHPGMNASRKARTEIRPETVRLTKYFDKSSTNLCLHLKNRELYTTATITVMSMVLGGPGGKNIKLMTMQLSDGYIEAIDISASESGKSMAVKERVTLSFRKCKLMYYPENIAQGGREAPTTFELEASSIGT